jgi:Tetratricopeptide repeat.
MEEERDWFLENDSVFDAIRRFEDMMEKKARYFFDVYEFEEIINFYIETNNFSKAVAAAEYGYRMYPESTIIQLKIAHLLIDRGKAAESIGILEKIEQIEQSNYEVYILKGSAYNLLGKVSEARQHFDKAVSLSHTDEREAVLYNIGLTFEQQSNYDTAIQYFLEAHKTDPSNITVLFDLAFCYDHLNNPEQSIIFYNKYLDEEPYSDLAWFNLGTVYNKVDDFEKAIEAYDFAIAINESYGSAYYNKANVLSNMERFSDALKDYLEFLKLDEKHVLAHCYVGECFEKLGLYDKSLFYFQQALALDTNCSEAWFGQGVIKMHLGDYEESLTYINKALDLNEDNTEYLYAKGLLYMKQKDFDNGIQIFNQLVELDPTDFEAWLNYSELLMDSGKTDSATYVLTKANDLNFNNAYINLRLASYSFMQNNMDQGLAYLEKALNLDIPSVDELFDFYPEASQNEKIGSLIECKMGKKS